MKLPFKIVDSTVRYPNGHVEPASIEAQILWAIHQRLEDHFAQKIQLEAIASVIEPLQPILSTEPSIELPDETPTPKPTKK